MPPAPPEPVAATAGEEEAGTETTRDLDRGAVAGSAVVSKIVSLIKKENRPRTLKKLISFTGNTAGTKEERDDWRSSKKSALFKNMTLATMRAVATALQKQINADASGEEAGGEAEKTLATGEMPKPVAPEAVTTTPDTAVKDTTTSDIGAETSKVSQRAKDWLSDVAAYNEENPDSIISVRLTDVDDEVRSSLNGAIEDEWLNDVQIGDNFELTNKYAKFIDLWMRKSIGQLFKKDSETGRLIEISQGELEQLLSDQKSSTGVDSAEEIPSQTSDDANPEPENKVVSITGPSAPPPVVKKSAAAKETPAPSEDRWKPLSDRLTEKGITEDVTRKVLEFFKDQTKVVKLVEDDVVSEAQRGRRPNSKDPELKFTDWLKEQNFGEEINRKIIEAIIDVATNASPKIIAKSASKLPSKMGYTKGRELSGQPKTFKEVEPTALPMPNKPEQPAVVPAVKPEIIPSAVAKPQTQVAKPQTPTAIKKPEIVSTPEKVAAPSEQEAEQMALRHLKQKIKNAIALNTRQIDVKNLYNKANFVDSSNITALLNKIKEDPEIKDSIGAIDSKPPGKIFLKVDAKTRPESKKPAKDELDLSKLRFGGESGEGQGVLTGDDQEEGLPDEDTNTAKEKVPRVSTSGTKSSRLPSKKTAFSGIKQDARTKAQMREFGNEKTDFARSKFKEILQDNGVEIDGSLYKRIAILRNYKTLEGNADSFIELISDLEVFHDITSEVEGKIKEEFLSALEAYDKENPYIPEIDKKEKTTDGLEDGEGSEDSSTDTEYEKDEREDEEEEEETKRRQAVSAKRKKALDADIANDAKENAKIRESLTRPMFTLKEGVFRLNK